MMTQIDRYLLKLQLRPFAFFSLVFIGILWLVQSLSRLDDIISNGQSADVFVKVALLMLPQVMVLVIPLAAFASTIYSINQLFLDAELVIMIGIGKSNLSLSRPVIIFGGLIAIIMFGLSIYIVPLTQNKLKDLMFEIKQNITTQLVRYGHFFHPAKGVSIYIRESNKTGEMRGIFITDSRDKERNLTYSSREAILHKANSNLVFIMQDGLLQISNPEKNGLMTIAFDRLVLNLNEFLPNNTRNFVKPIELFPTQVLWNFEGIDNIDFSKKNEYYAEAHLKLATPLSALSLTLLALTIFLTSGYNRKGFATPIYLGITLGIVSQAITLSLKSIVSENLGTFWLLYSPSIATLIICFAILMLTQETKIRDRTP